MNKPRLLATVYFVTQVQSSQPQMETPSAKTRHTTYRSFRTVHPVLHSWPFYPVPPKLICCTMLFSLPDTPRVSLPLGSSTLHVMHVPWTNQTQHPKLHLDRFSRFGTARCRESILLRLLYKTANNSAKLTNTVSRFPGCVTAV